MSSVFDASALVALVKNEPGADITERLLADGAQRRLVHGANVSETLYHFLRRNEGARIEAALAAFAASGLVGREDMDRDFARSMARIKVSIPQASLGDCIALALAQRVGGTVVTADHPAFEQAAALGICSVTFIR